MVKLQEEKMNELELKKLLNQCLTKKDCIDLIYLKMSEDNERRKRRFGVERSFKDYIWVALERKEDILFDEINKIHSSISKPEFLSLELLAKHKEIDKLHNQLDKLNRCKMKLINSEE